MSLETECLAYHWNRVRVYKGKQIFYGKLIPRCTQWHATHLIFEDLRLNPSRWVCKIFLSTFELSLAKLPMKKAVGLSPIGPIGTYLKKLSTDALNKPKHFITGAKSFLNCYDDDSSCRIDCPKVHDGFKNTWLDLNWFKYVGKFVILTHTHKLWKT